MLNEDYLKCSSYTGHGTPSENGFVSFHDESSNRYFFALLDKAGEVLLKSEGYQKDNSRDNGIDSVTKNRTIQDHYSVKSENGKYFVSLRAGNYKEIARSCDFDSEAAAMAAIAGIMGVIAKESKGVDDDYLVCSLYEGHPRWDENIDFAKFHHHNGEYYFVWYNEDGSIKLRSEGYASQTGRDNGLASVLKNKDNKDRYKLEEFSGWFFTVLKAGNNQEIARSCPKRDEAAALALWPMASAAAAKPIVSGKASSDVPPIVVEKAAYTAPNTATNIVPPVIVDDEKKGCAWWWLLPLLLLLGLLFWWWKGCNDEIVEAPVNIEDTTSIVQPPPVPDTETLQAPPSPSPEADQN